MNDDIDRMSMKELKREVRQLRQERESGYKLRYTTPTSEEVDADEKAAFALALRETYHNRGFAGVIEEAFRMYRANRTGKTLNDDLRRAGDAAKDFYRTALDDLQKIARRQPKTVYARALMLIIDPEHPGKFECKGTRAIPIRDRADVDGIWSQILFAIAQAPQPIDVKNQRVDGISDGALFAILAELFAPEYDPQTFNERRRELFEGIWAHIEREHPNEYERREIQDQFNKAVSRTQERMRNRIEKITVDFDTEL